MSPPHDRNDATQILDTLKEIQATIGGISSSSSPPRGAEEKSKTTSSLFSSFRYEERDQERGTAGQPGETKGTNSSDSSRQIIHGRRTWFSSVVGVVQRTLPTQMIQKQSFMAYLLSKEVWKDLLYTSTQVLLLVAVLYLCPPSFVISFDRNHRKHRFHWTRAVLLSTGVVLLQYLLSTLFRYPASA